MKKITLLLFAIAVTCFVTDMNAQTIPGTTGPVPTVGTSGNAQFTANVALTGTIGTDYDIDNVTITSMNHTFDGDLDISLIAPSGEIMLLSGGNGGSADDYIGTVFMNGNPCIESGGAPFTGTWEPEGGLATNSEGDCTTDQVFATVFAGADVNGLWILNIEDNFGGDSGFMNAWDLTFNSLGAAPITECGNAPELIAAGGATSGAMNPSIATVATVGTVGVDYSIASVDLDLNHTFDGDLDINLTSPGGIVLDLSNDNGGAGDNYTGTIFVDGGADINLGTPPFTGMFEPEGGTLNGTFAGEPVNGNWTLNIFDQFAGDSGVLNSYCINFDPILGSPPVIGCPADIVSSTDPGACGAVQNYSASAVDPDGDLDTVVQTVPDPNVLGSGDEFPVGTTMVTFRATDLMGNFSECTFSITVNDDELPVAACQDISVDLDANGMATIVPGDIDNGSSDNCPGLTYEMGVVGTPVAGSLTSLFATNNGGANGGAVYFDVTIGASDIDVTGFDMNTSEAGAFTMDAYILTGTAFGNEGNPGAWTLAGSGTGTAAGVDNPSVATLASSFTLSAGTSYGIALVFTSAHGHSYTNGTGGNQNYANADLSMTLGSASNAPFTGGIFFPRVFNGSVNYDVGGGIVPFSGDFDCSHVGANVITLTVTDASGNSSSCTSTVTVSDVTAPEIVCIGEQLTGPNTVSDAPGTAIVDNTTVSTTISVPDSFTITDLNVDMNITHTWVGDLTITLESPALTQVVIFDGGADGCSGDNIYDLYDDESANPLACQAGTGDAFPLDDYIPSNALSAFDGEDTAGTWTLYVEDGAGGDQGTIDSWSLIYDFAPIVAAPLEVDLDANGNATINASDLLLSVNEACGWTATVGGAPNPFTLLTTLAGGNGNFGNMFDVNALNDVTIDSFDIHGDTGATYDVEVYAKTGTYVGSETDPGAWTLIGTAPGVVSNGDGVVTPLNLALGYAMAAGETHAFYVTPTDFSTGGFNYTNGTTVGAVFASDANIEFLEGAGSGYPFNGTLFSPRVWNGNIQYSSGNGVSTTLDLDCSNLGENLIEVTVTDDSGNVATCMATVNVNDVTAPVLVCQDITLELGPDGTAVVDPMALLASLPGTYEVITISSDNQSGTPGETDLTVPITAADNISFDWDYSTMDGPAFDSFGYLLNGVYTELTDPAGANNQNGSAGPIAVAPGDVFGFRSASVDGVFGACTTVVSNFMPGFTGQFDPANWTETLNNSDGSATFVEIPGGPLSFDACGITVLAVDITEVTCADVGTPVTVTVFASDSSLNTAACVATITVVDLLAPVVTCPADITVDPGPGNLFYEVPDYFATGEATAEDNCTDPLTILTQDPAAGTLLPDGVYPVTMTAEDEFGNVGTCTFTLTIESVLGLDDNELDNAISMYPNPADSQVTISNSSNIQLEKAAIYDMNGKLIQQIDLSQMTGEQVIDVSYLSAGVYVVQIASDDSSAVKRLIKE